ncbi:Uncharacterised protein [Vibrio cholerae]|uniref:Uncharacterized protein n=1 Tax=Vibrio cholerae TaxID=666 RepID=A0A655XDQ6_VIBCL|nr:Uncharacterised protein [Vibrio cholerae]
MNKIIAMTGPESASIMPKILGLRIAAIQMVTNKKPMVRRSAKPSDTPKFLVSRPDKLSRAPKKWPRKEEVMAMKATSGPSVAINGLSVTLAR